MWPGEENGESKGERQIQPVISSQSVLHSLEHTKRFTDLGMEEKGEAGVLWCSQDLDLSLLLLVFSLICTVTSRLLHLYSTVGKTSRLKMKIFSTVRDTQRGS